MPKLRSGEEWAKSLRQDIKTEIGLGWNVCGHKRSDGTLSGSCKLTHRTGACQHPKEPLLAGMSEISHSIVRK